MRYRSTSNRRASLSASSRARRSSIVIALAVLTGCTTTERVYLPPPTTTTSTTSTTTTPTTTTTTRPALVVRLTSPVDLNYLLDRAAHDIMCRNAIPDDKPVFVDWFHDVERFQQEAAYAGKEHFVPDPYTYALNFLEDRRASDVDACAMSRQLENFSEILDDL